MEFIIVEAATTGTIAITLFGIVYCLMQTEYSTVSRSFAMFLGAVALNNTPDAFYRLFAMLDRIYVQQAELLVWMPSNLWLAPLLWVYVHTLTSTDQKRPARLHVHFLLPCLAVLFGVIAALAPTEVGASLVFGDPTPDSDGALAIAALVAIVQMLLYPQMAFYLILIIRRMMRYRLKLRDYYASTEEHELRWIYLIGGLSGLFWLVRTASVFLELHQDSANLQSIFLGFAGLFSVILVGALTLWGLRQRPPLMPQPEPDPSPDNAPNEPKQGVGEKYEKSALSEDASKRIERKLRAAMELDHLHRDPNLSLWALARHIGASPNYISQTLNEVIGESFFDFVNGFRIKEAKTLLSTTDATVLTITYDVGFNARSSFYNAFKRVTGQTPTAYRKKLSLPAGMDDAKP